jgi:hypothetical protein
MWNSPWRGCTILRRSPVGNALCGVPRIRNLASRNATEGVPYSLIEVHPPLNYNAAGQHVSGGAQE